MKLLNPASSTAWITAGAVLSAVMIVAAPAFAADAPRAAKSTYDQERAACLSGRSAQDTKTCLKEAAAARDEARRGTLSTASTEELANNAMLRCQRVAEADREDCRAMVMGQGTRDGSVASGAVLTRIERMVDENPTAAGTPASPASGASAPWIGASKPRPDVPPPRPPQRKGSAPAR